MQYEIVCYNYVGLKMKDKQLYRVYVTVQSQDNTSLYCAELHSLYENVVAAGQNPSP